MFHFQLSFVLTRVFAPYKCNIDRVFPSTGSNGIPIDGKVSVETHFIDTESNQPIGGSIIQK
jgi:hypothetical protein